MLLMPSLAFRVFVQLVPSMLYCTVPLVSGVVTLREPALLTLSLLLLPLSHTRPTVGASGAVLSTVKDSELTLLVLPALSKARAYTVLAPSSATKVVPHATPSVLYCKVAPVSALELITPFWVIWSLLLMPVSLTKVSTGALGAALSRVKL